MSRNNDPRPTRRLWRELALNVGAVAGAICILATLASVFLGITPLVVRSGSMSPEIPTGALALARSVPAADLRVGDVVSVDNQAGVRITHRVIGMEPSGDQVALTLKGDANRVADPVPYVVTQADRVLVSIPVLGYLVAWLSSKTAIFLGGLAAGALLMLAFGPGRRRPDAETSDDGASDDSASDDDEPTTSTIQAAAASSAQHQENTYA